MLITCGSERIVRQPGSVILQTLSRPACTVAILKQTAHRLPELSDPAAAAHASVRWRGSRPFPSSTSTGCGIELWELSDLIQAK